jgi:hypothetical protein
MLASDLLSTYIASHEPLQLPNQSIPFLFGDIQLSGVSVSKFSFDSFDVEIVDGTGVAIVMYVEVFRRSRL